jgi:hypothetical protein
MKRTILISLLIFFSISVFSKNRNDGNQCIKNTKLNVIQGIPVDKYIRIPPPESSNLKSVSATKIVVNYNGFSVSAKKAFQYAVDIWAGLINSSQTIYIDAYWKKLGARTLGSCGPTNYYMGYNGMLFDSVYFPSAVAEKLAKTDLNDDGEAELIANFSSDTDWYYGTDGKTPAGKYDLVTVVLHELCHGLGFTGSINVESGIGSWGWGLSFPFIFDHFLFDQGTNAILDTILYPNNSAKLKTAVTAGDVYFNGRYMLSTYGKRVQLFTPTTWDAGSSVYHVNTTFSTGPEGLMLPAVNTQTSIHDPGIIAQSVLGEIGWKSVDIQHEPIKNSEKIENVNVEVQFSADYSTSYIEPFLHYSIDSSAYVDVELNAGTMNKFIYSATIPITKASNISYYITVKDKMGRIFKQPVSGANKGFGFYYGPDTIAPTIKHYPNTFLLKGQDSLFIEANVNDGFGVDNVWVQYRINNQKFDSLLLNNTEKDKYSATILLSKYNLQVNDSVEYRILASDVSKAGNVAYFPKEESIKMKVEEIPDFIPEYENDFEGSGHDFILQGFNVDIPNGFETGALSTNHPYEFAGDNSTLNYIAQLRYPIKLSETLHYISFDEIALVEPGEKGTVYGDKNFYDYVIVEGSKDQGKTWVPFEPGWDCRRVSEWENVYNQSVISQYSQAIGTPSLYRNHLIDMTSTSGFMANDTVLVRFRLFSDPFAYGWGWAIDNLKIQTAKVSSTTIADSRPLIIYPNPVTDHVIYFKSNNKNDKINVNIMDLAGRKLLQFSDFDMSGTLQLPNSLKGFYFISVENSGEIDYYKIMVK